MGFRTGLRQSLAVALSGPLGRAIKKGVETSVRELDAKLSREHPALARRVSRPLDSPGTVAPRGATPPDMARRPGPRQKPIPPRDAPSAPSVQPPGKTTSPHAVLGLDLAPFNQRMFTQSTEKFESMLVAARQERAVNYTHFRADLGLAATRTHLRNIDSIVRNVEAAAAQRARACEMRADWPVVEPEISRALAVLLAQADREREAISTLQAQFESLAQHPAVATQASPATAPMWAAEDTKAPVDHAGARIDGGAAGWRSRMGLEVLGLMPGASPHAILGMAAPPFAEVTGYGQLDERGLGQAAEASAQTSAGGNINGYLTALELRRDVILAGIRDAETAAARLAQAQEKKTSSWPLVEPEISRALAELLAQADVELEKIAVAEQRFASLATARATPPGGNA